MKFEYKKRYKHELKLSERQLEQMSALHLASWFMDISSNHLKDLSNINPEWIELQKYKNFEMWYIEELKKKGFWDNGRIKITKTKKGYVLQMKFNWRSKGIKTTQTKCKYCNKLKDLNWHLFCKNCTDKIGSKGIMKFWRKKC